MMAKMRTVLTIDTATPAVTAGVVEVGTSTTTLGTRVAVDARAHAEWLTPNVLAALEDSDRTMGDLDAVVVGVGPGPFTGLRVGMATAAAYGHALGIPVFGVCSLDAIAVGAARVEPGPVLVVTDARRREVYWARYTDGVRSGAPEVSAPGDIPAEVLDGLEAVAGSPQHAALFGLPVFGPESPLPADLVAVVQDWDAEPEPLVPLYLRRPDAKTLAERQAAR